MVIDFAKEIQSLDGKPITKSEGVNATLQYICREALLAQYQDEKVNGEEKFKRWNIAKKLEGKVNLQAEEITKIKELIGKAFSPAVVGPAYEALENETK